MTDLKIMLTGCLLYEDKETKQQKTRLGYHLMEPSMKQNEKNFKGFTDLGVYYDGSEIYNKLPVEIFGQVVTAIIEEKPNPRNPLRKTSVIKSIKAGSSVIDLV